MDMDVNVALRQCRPSAAGRVRPANVRLLPLAALLLSALPAMAGTAFFYGANPPVAELSAFERVVLQPALVDRRDVLALRAAGVTVHAYVSLGEIRPDDPLFGTLPEEALAGSNPAWHTRVADLGHPAWRTLILETRLAPLADWGFQGVFLDTLDSYHLLENQEEQKAALADLLATIQRRYPDLELILNRGFEILADLPEPVAAVAAESLYQGWDAARASYRTVGEEERGWLLDRLSAAQAFAGEVIVIDYAPDTDPERRQALARRIREHGFQAWVTGPDLLDLGTSDLVPVPRRLLVLHHQADAALTEREVHVMFGVIFDWLGYVVEYHDVREGMPSLVPGVHAGVVTWLDTEQTDSLPWFEDWLLNALDHGIRLVVLGQLPTHSPRVLQRLGLSVPSVGPGRTVVGVSRSSSLVGGFEAPLRARSYQIPYLVSNGEDNDVRLALEMDDGTGVTPIVLGQWGGVAVHPYIVEDYGRGHRRWILDPYAFIARALRHESRPVFDTTTENGSRLLTVHVDGDGFPSRSFLPGSPYSAEVFLREFLQKYDLPHTVSVIEAEISATGLYPEQSDALEALAREILRHPKVEVASHSYSHPFYWRPEILGEGAAHEYGMHLPVGGYHISMEREIDGSVRYINEHLAPEGKPVSVFLWTGSADPDAAALERADRLGLANVNGGNTIVLMADESLLNVWPQGRLDGRSLQVYAPAMNENVYTNNWTGPFYGYRKAVETFQLTDRPRRLKPISIYYHFYSATRPASIRALHEVYRWALEETVLPIPLSGFARRVQDYHRAWLYRDLSGNWVAGNLGELRTLRFPAAEGYAVPVEGGLAGQTKINDQRYLHLTGEELRFRLAKRAPEGLTLVRANAPLLRWEAVGDEQVDVRFSGALPVSFTVRAEGRDCTLNAGGRVTAADAGDDGQLNFMLDRKDTGNARLVCTPA